MARHVEDVNAYTRNLAGSAVLVGRGITHYRCDWQNGMAGDTIQADLVTAGLPSTVSVVYDGGTGKLDVALLLDDAGAWQASVTSVVAAHGGT